MPAPPSRPSVRDPNLRSQSNAAAVGANPETPERPQKPEKPRAPAWPPAGPHPGAPPRENPRGSRSQASAAAGGASQAPDGATALRSAPDPATWLIDGYNVLHTVLLGGQPRTGSGGWGQAGRSRLLERVRGFEGLDPGSGDRPEADSGREDRPGTVWVVFDGRRPSPDDAGANPRVVFAPSADGWIVRRVRSSSRPSALVVVSADRQLAGRCRHAGASVLSPRDFIGRCPSPEA